MEATTIRLPPGGEEDSLAHSLSYLALIWVGVFAAVLAARLTRLTPPLYFLAVGALLVNIGLLPEDGDLFIRGLAEFGIIAIMFALGFEEQTSNFLTSIKKSWGIAFFGALAPFSVAYAVAIFFWGDTNVALLTGLTMTATAVSLTMVSLKSEGLGGTPAATRIMTSAVLDDIASLALVAIVVPFATGQGEISIVGIATILGKTIVFFLIVTFIGAWCFPEGAERRWGLPAPGRFGLRHVLALFGGEYATFMVVLLALVFGLVSHALGFHPAVGAYMAGLILREEYFRSKRSEAYLQTKATLDAVAYMWIGPVFFVQLGSQLVFDRELALSVIPETLVMTLGVIVFQVLSAGLASRLTGGLPWAESWLVGVGMLGRAELAFVVLDIAYVEHRILSREAFYTLMFSAFWLNVSVPVAIRLWRATLGRNPAGRFGLSER